MKTLTILSFFVGTSVWAATQPNIVLVITDDQGYGDLACNGNPHVISPHIDKLSSESTNLSDFHAFPTCAPTRAALMTGRWANRTGVWHTIMGRSLIRQNEVTLAQMLKDGGYETGIFGKWHLGDGYPFRPEDKGFTYTYYHGAGGVGQTPDVWNNSYFDGSYHNNGKITKAKGYCTDIFFEEGNKFITNQVKEGKPFFAYISLNAPHKPLISPQKYIDMYDGVKISPEVATFYAMITNIDENVGETRKLIKDLGVEDNTIFIFMTDNGSASGASVFNSEMRGAKGSEYEGGHRVPFMIHYPEGKLTEKLDVSTLTHVVDIAPTLLELCNVQKEDAVKFDGKSILPLLKGDTENWADRYVISDSQRVVDPVKWKQSSTMIQDWRLINGTELYYLPDDPSQKNDLAEKFPEKVATLRSFYEEWWSELEPTYAETAEFIIGNEKANPVRLTSHDWISPLKKYPPWNQASVRQLSKFVADSFLGYWAVEVEKGGEYKIDLFRWAPESNLALSASVAAEPDHPGPGKPYCAHDGVAIPIKEAVFLVDEKEVWRGAVDPTKPSVSFKLSLKPGKQKLSAYFITDKDKHLGVIYTVLDAQ